MDVYLTRNGTRLNSITMRPSERDHDPTRWYTFLDVTGTLMTPRALAIKPLDWTEAHRYEFYIK